MLFATNALKKVTAKNVVSHKTVQKSVPKTAVRFEVLRSMETALGRKHLLFHRKEVTPLWFVAETERNVFLWRHGLSLDDRDEYDFWVDVPELIQKRIKQLGSSKANNPFCNPLWGFSTADEIETKASNEGEIEYLRSFGALNRPLLGHAHALSHVGRALEEEYLDGSAKETVVLPVQKQTQYVVE